ncbi:alaserpin-like isoform X2 [Cylas formicarius]|uniref:alaserpin-like isoform X2 n=1 Tax=Cylas formicarius TaxID=197179 RepID=UPI00295893BB|nr:alaserpin-like isoform X2 [Cylas formicarius]
MMKNIGLVFWTIVAGVTCQNALEEFKQGNIKFSARLYKEVLKENKNFIISPFSIEVILGLTQAGAVGRTFNEFTSSLNLPSTQNKTQEALKEFLPSLQHNSDNLTLTTANKLYLGKNLSINKNFENIAKSIYHAGAQNVDFANAEKAAKIINDWVEQQTKNKIQNLIDPKLLNEFTRLVLVNTLYFSGTWTFPFEKRLTRKGKFYSGNNSTDVELMHLVERFGYYDDREHKAQFLELKFRGGNVSLTVILPHERNGLTAVEQNVEDLLKPRPLQTERVAVTLPKFTTSSSFALKPILQNLGLKIAFTKQANFSELSQEPLYIDTVIQKAFVNVSESGVEAAAATAVLMISGSILPRPSILEVIVDHPFLYVVKYNRLVLFVGRIFKLN